MILRWEKGWRVAHLYVFCKGGWPTFTFFVKVGIHAACAGILIFALPH